MNVKGKVTKKIKHIAISAAIVSSVPFALNALSGGGIGGNAQTTQTAQAPRTESQPAERKFVMDAANGNLAEIRAAQLAKQRASNAEVRDFAQTMINDHTRANDELAQIAQRMGVTPPKDIDPFHRAAAAGMSNLSGMEFDVAYVKGQLGDHALMLDILETQEKSGKDPELSRYAARIRPAVASHYEQARQLDDRMSAVAMKADK
jgi:putative membrane protein